jgi:hypothetical protein
MALPCPPRMGTHVQALPREPHCNPDMTRTLLSVVRDMRTQLSVPCCAPAQTDPTASMGLTILGGGLPLRSTGHASLRRSINAKLGELSFCVTPAPRVVRTIEWRKIVNAAAARCGTTGRRGKCCVRSSLEAFPLGVTPRLGRTTISGCRPVQAGRLF